MADHGDRYIATGPLNRCIINNRTLGPETNLYLQVPRQQPPTEHTNARGMYVGVGLSVTPLQQPNCNSFNDFSRCNQSCPGDHSAQLCSFQATTNHEAQSRGEGPVSNERMQCNMAAVAHGHIHGQLQYNCRDPLAVVCLSPSTASDSYTESDSESDVTSIESLENSFRATVKHEAQSRGEGPVYNERMQCNIAADASAVVCSSPSTASDSYTETDSGSDATSMQTSSRNSTIASDSESDADSETMPGATDAEAMAAMTHAETMPGATDAEAMVAMTHAETMPGATDAEAMVAMTHAETMPGATDAEAMVAMTNTEMIPGAPAAEAMCYRSDIGPICNVSTAEVKSDTRARDAASDAIAADDRTMPGKIDKDHVRMPPNMLTTASEITPLYVKQPGVVQLQNPSPPRKMSRIEGTDPHTHRPSTPQTHPEQTPLISPDLTDKVKQDDTKMTNNNGRRASTVSQEISPANPRDRPIHTLMTHKKTAMQLQQNNKILINNVLKWLSTTKEEIDKRTSDGMLRLNDETKNTNMLNNYNRILKYILHQKTLQSWYFLLSVIVFTEPSRQAQAMQKIVDHSCFISTLPKRLVIRYFEPKMKNGFVFCLNRERNIFYRYFKKESNQEKNQSVWVLVEGQNQEASEPTTYSIKGLWHDFMDGLNNGPQQISDGIYLHHTNKETGHIPYCALQQNELNTPTDQEYHKTLQALIEKAKNEHKNAELANYFYVSHTPEERAKQLSMYNGQRKLRETHLRFLHEVLEHQLIECTKTQASDEISYAQFRDFASNLMLIYVGAANTKIPTGELWKKYTHSTPLHKDLKITDRGFIDELCNSNRPASNGKIELRLTHHQIKKHKTITIQSGSWVAVDGQEYIVHAERSDRYLPDLLRIFPGDVMLIDPQGIDEEQLRLDLDLTADDPCLQVEQKFFDMAEARDLAKTCHRVGIRWKRLSVNGLPSDSDDITNKYEELCNCISHKKEEANKIKISAAMQAKIFGTQKLDVGTWIQSTFSGFCYQLESISTHEVQWKLLDTNELDSQWRHKDQDSCERFMCTVAPKMGKIRLEEWEYKLLDNVKFEKGKNVHFKCQNDEIWVPWNIIPVFLSDARDDRILTDMTNSNALTHVLAYIEKQPKSEKRNMLFKKAISAYVKKAIFNVEEKLKSYVANSVWLLLLAGFFNGEKFAQCYGHIKSTLFTFVEISKTMPLLFDDINEGHNCVNELIEEGMVSEFFQDRPEGPSARPHAQECRKLLLRGTQMREKEKNKHIAVEDVIFGKTFFFNESNRILSGTEVTVPFHKYSSGKRPKDMYNASWNFTPKEKQQGEPEEAIFPFETTDENQATINVPLPKNLYIPKSDVAGGKSMFYVTIQIGDRLFHFVPSVDFVTYEQISAKKLQKETNNQRIVKRTNSKLQKNDPTKAMELDWANQNYRAGYAQKPWLPVKFKETGGSHDFPNEAARVFTNMIYNELLKHIIAGVLQAITYLPRQTPTLKQGKNNTETNAKLDQILSNLVKTPNEPPAKFIQGDTGTTSNKISTEPANLKESLADACEQFKNQQKSLIMWRDRLVGPFWLLGYMHTHALSKILTWVYYHSILNTTERRNKELNELDLTELDPQALAAIHQTLRYTMIQNPVVTALVSTLETKFPVNAESEFTHIRDAALAANLAPKEYRTYIQNTVNNPNSNNFLRFVERQLAIRWFNVITLASRPTSDGDGSERWSTSKTQEKISQGALVRSRQTSRGNNSTMLFARRSVFDWPENSPAIRRIIELDLENVLKHILTSKYLNPRTRAQQSKTPQNPEKIQESDPLQQILNSIVYFKAFRCLQEFTTWFADKRRWEYLELHAEYPEPAESPDDPRQTHYSANLCSNMTYLPAQYNVPRNFENDNDFNDAFVQFRTRYTGFVRVMGNGRRSGKSSL